MSTPNSEKHQTPVSARRRLLQIMAVGGTAAVVLPEKWVKPVVDAVMVPAHAAGSVVPVFGIFGNHGTLAVADNGQGNFLERVAGMVAGSAHAMNTNTIPPCRLEKLDGSVVDIQFIISANSSNGLANVIVNCYAPFSTPAISTVNTISNVICNDLTFSNVTWNRSTLTGTCISNRTDCNSGDFILYNKVAGACIPNYA